MTECMFNRLIRHALRQEPNYAIHDGQYDDKRTHGGNISKKLSYIILKKILHVDDDAYSDCCFIELGFGSCATSVIASILMDRPGSVVSVELVRERYDRAAEWVSNLKNCQMNHPVIECGDFLEPSEAPNVWNKIQSGRVIIFINNAQGVWLSQMNRLDSMINKCCVGSIVVSLERMLLNQPTFHEKRIVISNIARDEVSWGGSTGIKPLEMFIYTKMDRKSLYFCHGIRLRATHGYENDEMIDL